MVFSQLKNRDFYTKTLHILVPVLLQQLITTGINFLDNVMIGSFGEAPIGAVSLANQYYAFFQFVCMGLGSGAIVMSAQFWGGHQEKHLKTVAAIALRFTLAISAAFTLLSVLWPQAVLGVFTNDPAVIAAGIRYTRLIGSTMLFAGLSSSVTYLLRSTGHVKVPLISSAIAFFLNLFFNWVFIFGKLGMPRLEATGAAVGTVIARCVEFFIICGYFISRKETHFSFRIRDIFLSGRTLIRQYIRFSLPVLFSDTLLGLGLSLNSVIIGHIDAVFVAANAIVATGNQLLNILNTSVAGASAVVIGNTIGDGDKEKGFQEGIAYVVIAVTFGVCFSIITLLLKEPYLRIYSVTEETLETCRSLFRYLIIFLPLQALSYCCSKGILRGGGDTRFLMVFDILLLWVVSLPLGSLAGLVWHMTPFWVFFFLKLEFAAKGLICLGRILSKKWIKTVNPTDT